MPTISTWSVFSHALPMTPRFSYPLFEQLRAGFPDPDGLAAMSRVARVRARLQSGEPEPANIQLVSGEFFGVLGLQPQLGRFLSPDDNRAVGGHPVAVISDAYWRRKFDGAADTIGRELTLNGVRVHGDWRDAAGIRRRLARVAGRFLDSGR